MYCKLLKTLTLKGVQFIITFVQFQLQNNMFDKTILLLAFVSIAATTFGNYWSEKKAVSKTNSDACAEAKKPLRECYEIIYNRLAEEIILKGDCASYQVYWPSGKMSKWYKGNENDNQNKPCNRAKCIISSACNDGWKVESNRRWDKIILNGNVPAFSVKVDGVWSQWYEPQENAEE